MRLDADRPERRFIAPGTPVGCFHDIKLRDLSAFTAHERVVHRSGAIAVKRERYVARPDAVMCHLSADDIANDGLRAKFVPVAGIDWSF